MEFIIGGASAAFAVCFTNPMEVVKCRFQLQGELKSKGNYTVHYRNIFHAFYTIAKTDGILSLEKGLTPAIFYQICLSGCRLGLFQVAQEREWISKTGGGVSFLKSMAFSTFGGCVGGFIATPFYLVKTHAQVEANESIAVGYQRKYKGTFRALYDMYSEHGIKSLWRGASTIVFRIGIASCSQVPTFTQCKYYLKTYEVFPNPGGFLDTVVAAIIGGFVGAIMVTPFDTVSTRFCNQGVDAEGKGLLYKNGLDCMIKCLKKEGILGLYKGLIPCYFRIGPYAILTFVFWDSLKSLQKRYSST